MIPGSGRPGTEPMMSLAGGDSNDSYSEPQEETISQQSLPEGYLEDQIDNLLEQLKKLQVCMLEIRCKLGVWRVERVLVDE